MEIRIKDLIMDLFEVGEKYKIKTYNEVDEFVKCVCTVKSKDEYRLIIDVHETDGEDEGITHIPWSIIESVESL